MFESISNAEAKQLIAEKKDNAKFSILDVRTPEEFQGGAIAGAKNINIYEPDFRAKLNALDKEGSYLVYCRSGARSKAAAKIMQQLDFSEVYEIDNGFTNFQ